ncbi:hypothetical protein FRC09_000057 [Ceratobasidium sp. 395]|nr:hypothetical protein FRC09_000057 [Ceratobasidium sp. 395]
MSRFFPSNLARLRDDQQQPDASSVDRPMAPAYERDVPGTELDKDALVWKVYVKETDQADKEMCDDWDNIEAALFSAILTA